MANIIVFGASGLLGATLVPALRSLGHNVLGQSRSQKTELVLNPSERVAVFDTLIKHRPDAVINLVAATNVDQCEEQPNLAWWSNAHIVDILTESIEAFGELSGVQPHLIHVSTDQVYDGLGPHIEDNVNIINVYGLSKFAGELFADRVGATVLRTNFYGRSRCPNRISFSDWLVHSLREQIPITVFDNVKFSAMHIDTLCSVIARCVEQRPVGIFNAGCRDGISKAGFAFALANAMRLPTDKVSVGISSNVSLKARRPCDMTLQVQRLENTLSFQCPTMSEEIQYTAKEYLND